MRFTDILYYRRWFILKPKLKGMIYNIAKDQASIFRAEAWLDEEGFTTFLEHGKSVVISRLNEKLS